MPYKEAAAWVSFPRMYFLHVQLEKEMKPMGNEVHEGVRMHRARFPPYLGRLETLDISRVEVNCSK